MSALRENWRIVALTALLLLSVVALFGPANLLATAGETDGPTNLQYGIELDGGAQIRAPLNGFVATGVEYDPAAESEIQTALQEELGLDADEVVLSRGERSTSGQPTVEVFPANTIQRSDFDSDAAFEAAENASENVSQREFVAAMRSAGVTVDEGDVRRGVTERTLQQTRQIINDKISTAGLSGGSAQIARSGGDAFVVVQAPNRDVADLRALVESEGEVEVLAYYQRNGTFVNETLIDQSMQDSYSVSAVRTDDSGEPFVSLTFTRDDENTLQFQERAGRIGEGQRWVCGDGQIPYDRNTFTQASGNDKCLLTVFDGEVVYAAGVQPDLSRSWADGSWARDPQFRINAPDRERAEQVRIALQSGSLPATLDFDRGDEFSVEPALAQQFRQDSLITGIIAVLAVSMAVFLRYGRARVALPMIVTALSEVVVLMGFAAAIGYPLDLSVIAGFIAVIGTGVDDLIIIADEVMSEGEVNSSRVFDSRFKRAFWVIGAAAATTIIAMSPLAVLSLGDLQGFAIITILGVIIGVTITRPAYGDILRRLTTER